MRKLVEMCTNLPRPSNAPRGGPEINTNILAITFRLNFTETIYRRNDRIEATNETPAQSIRHTQKLRLTKFRFLFFGFACIRFGSSRNYSQNDANIPPRPRKLPRIGGPPFEPFSIMFYGFVLSFNFYNNVSTHTPITALESHTRNAQRERINAKR